MSELKTRWHDYGRRFVSMILAFCMLLQSALPSTAFAAQNYPRLGSGDGIQKNEAGSKAVEEKPFIKTSLARNSGGNTDFDQGQMMPKDAVALKRGEYVTAESAIKGASGASFSQIGVHIELPYIYSTIDEESQETRYYYTYSNEPAKAGDVLLGGVEMNMSPSERWNIFFPDPDQALATLDLLEGAPVVVDDEDEEGEEEIPDATASNADSERKAKAAYRATDSNAVREQLQNQQNSISTLSDHEVVGGIKMPLNSDSWPRENPEAGSMAGWYQGSVTVLEKDIVISTASPSFLLSFRFWSVPGENLPEGVEARVYTWAHYDRYANSTSISQQEMDTDIFLLDGSVEPFNKMDSSELNKMTLVYTNLNWDCKFEARQDDPSTNFALGWQKYNYASYDFEISNTSGMEQKPDGTWDFPRKEGNKIDPNELPPDTALFEKYDVALWLPSNGGVKTDQNQLIKWICDPEDPDSLRFPDLNETYMSGRENLPQDQFYSGVWGDNHLKNMRPDLMEKHEKPEDYVAEYDNLGGALILDVSGIYNLDDPELIASYEREENPYVILDDPRYWANGEPLAKIVPYNMNSDTTIRIHGEDKIYPPHMQYKINHPDEFLEEKSDVETYGDEGYDYGETGIMLINDLPPEEQPEETPVEQKEEEPVVGPAASLMSEEEPEPLEADDSNQQKYPSKRHYRLYTPYDNQFPAKMAGQDFVANVESEATVIYGNNLLWNKNRDTKTYFQVQDADGFDGDKQVETKISAVGRPLGYMMKQVVTPDNEQHTSVPIYSPYVLDTLPDYYDLTAIQFIMEGDIQDEKGIDAWLASQDLLRGVGVDYREEHIEGDEDYYKVPKFQLQMLDGEGEEFWFDFVETERKREVNRYDDGTVETVWTLKADEQIEDYLKVNPDVTVGKVLRINYKSVFLPGDECPGRVKITGIPRISGKFTNKADFKYPRMDYREFGDEGVDSEVADYISDKKGYFYTKREYEIKDKIAEREAENSDLYFKAWAHTEMKGIVKEDDKLLNTPMDLEYGSYVYRLQNRTRGRAYNTDVEMEIPYETIEEE